MGPFETRTVVPPSPIVASVPASAIAVARWSDDLVGVRHRPEHAVESEHDLLDVLGVRLEEMDQLGGCRARHGPVSR